MQEINKGDIAELYFMARAMELGLKVTVPLTHNIPYDVATDNGQGLKRIQIKSTTYQEDPGTFCVSVGKGMNYKERYKLGQFEYYALNIVPLDLWYIIPQEIIKVKKIRIRPQRESCRFKDFKEAWTLLL
jgi:hypothetical protein